MKKLTHIALALANNTLSERAMSHIKGGLDPLASAPVLAPLASAPLTTISSILVDEKRRERPGGGINTN